MKITRIIVTLLLSYIAAAWNLEFTAKDGTNLKTSGRGQKYCHTLKKPLTSPTTKIHWNPEATGGWLEKQIWGLSNFVAYETKDCSVGTGIRTFWRRHVKTATDFKLKKPIVFRSYSIHEWDGLDVCKVTASNS
jgi:hypothetical protein